LRRVFSVSGPEIQRQLATGLFNRITLKDGKITVAPQIPFSLLPESLAKGQSFARTADKEAFFNESLN
jgi:hypothetical protein